MKTEKVPSDVGRDVVAVGVGWGCDGKGKWKCKKNKLFGEAGGVRSLFEGHSPGGATVSVMLFGRACRSGVGWGVRGREAECLKSFLNQLLVFSGLVCIFCVCL